MASLTHADNTLLQTRIQIHSDDKYLLDKFTAGCIIDVSADGMVFMLLLVVQRGDKVLYNILTQLQ